MNEQPLSDELAALLEQLILGEVDPDDPRVVDAMQRSELFAREHKEYRACMETLDEDAADVAASGAVDEADLAWARDALASVSGQSAPSTRWLGGWLLAAIVLVAVGVGIAMYAQSQDPDPGPGPGPVPQILGGEVEWLAPPEGAVVEAGMALSWRCDELDPDQRYVLEVFDAEETRVWGSRPLRRPALTLQAEDLETWPEQFTMRILVIDGFGAEIGDSAPRRVSR